jgi:hypothetical protein
MMDVKRSKKKKSKTGAGKKSGTTKKGKKK